MPLFEHSRNDFVLGMSLAEVILLLLFCFFLVYALERQGVGGQDAPVQIARLKEETEKLQKENKDLQLKQKELEQKLREAEGLIEQLRIMVGGKGTDLSDFKRAIIGLKRGFPTCLDENTLVEILVKNSVIHLTILVSDQTLERFLGGYGVHVKKGKTINNQTEIDVFLNILWKYENQKGKECRFDYRLRYATDQDYRLGREKFERYLYPERMVQVAQ